MSACQTCKHDNAQWCDKSVQGWPYVKSCRDYQYASPAPTRGKFEEFSTLNPQRSIRIAELP